MRPFRAHELLHNAIHSTTLALILPMLRQEHPLFSVLFFKRTTILIRATPSTVKRFTRVTEPQFAPDFAANIASNTNTRRCPACRRAHLTGACPLKVAGPEHCNLCGLAHFGFGRTCPHINSETQVRAMIECLRQSNEPKHLVEAAVKYLRGVKGHLVQKKKMQQLQAGGSAGTGQQPGLSTSQAALNAVAYVQKMAAGQPNQQLPQPPVVPSQGVGVGAQQNGGAVAGAGARTHDDAAVAAALSGYLAQTGERPAGGGGGGSGRGGA